MAQTVKRLPAMWETRVQPLAQEDPLEKEMGNPLQYSCLENPLDTTERLHFHFLVASKRNQHKTAPSEKEQGGLFF